MNLANPLSSAVVLYGTYIHLILPNLLHNNLDRLRSHLSYFNGIMHAVLT